MSTDWLQEQWEPIEDWGKALAEVFWQAMTSPPGAGPEAVSDFVALWGLVVGLALFVLSGLVDGLSLLAGIPDEEAERQRRIDTILEAGATEAAEALARRKEAEGG